MEEKGLGMYRMWSPPIFALYSAAVLRMPLYSIPLIPLPWSIRHLELWQGTHSCFVFVENCQIQMVLNESEFWPFCSETESLCNSLNVYQW